MEDLLLNPKKILGQITKFIKIKKISELKLTEMDGKFISSLNGKIVVTRSINRNINKDYSNLLPNDLYYCSLIKPARNFYKYPKFKKANNNFILYFLRHLAFIGKHREISINPYVIFKRIIYTIINYSIDRKGKIEFEKFLKKKMKKKISIFCTLGPSSLNKDFLKFSSKKIDLLRLNMSHIDPKKFKKNN